MLYINSIVKVLLDSVTCLSFADDVRIYTVVRSDRPTDKVNLQNALDRVSDWSVKWQMPISAGKCSVTVYGKSVTITKPYYLCGCRLKFMDIVKDVGVTMNCNLQFTEHINCIVGKAHSRAYLIMVALRNRADHYIFMLFLLSFFISSPNLSGQRLDVYHTSTHGVALVRI